MSRKAIAWTEDLFHKYVNFIDRNILFQRLKESLSGGELEEIELDKDYIVSQDLFGVKIENGLLRIHQIIVEDALRLLNNLSALEIKRGVCRILPKEDLNAIVEITKTWGLEMPDVNAIQGYILNQELVEIDDGEYTVFRIKYKDDPENIFYIYRFYFVEIENTMYLVIEKNI